MIASLDPRPWVTPGRGHEWGAKGWHDSPWLRLFRNARRWLG